MIASAGVSVFNNSVPLLSGVVTAVTYKYNPGNLTRVYCRATPTSGTVLVEVTAASSGDVKGVEAGTPNANVLWESWTPGTASTASTDLLQGPWTAIRVTATNAIVNICGG